MKDNQVMYTFTHVDKHECEGYPDETCLTKTSVFDSASTWDVVLRDFIRFLEGIYGYNISDQIEIETARDRLDRILAERKIEDEDEDTSDPT
jgi:hypothetical protein